VKDFSQYLRGVFGTPSFLLAALPRYGQITAIKIRTYYRQPLAGPELPPVIAAGTISSANEKHSLIWEVAALASMYTPPHPKCRNIRNGPNTR
jgi:hypothetical protein